MAHEIDEVEPKKCKCGGVLRVKYSSGKNCQVMQNTMVGRGDFHDADRVVTVWSWKAGQLS